MDMESQSNEQYEAMDILLGGMSGGQYGSGDPPPSDWSGWARYTRAQWLDAGIIPPDGAMVGNAPTMLAVNRKTWNQAPSFGGETKYTRSTSTAILGGATALGYLFGGPLGAAVGLAVGFLLDGTND